MEDLGVGPHCQVVDWDKRCVCGRRLKTVIRTVADRAGNRQYRYRYIECPRAHKGARRRVGRTEVLQQSKTKH